MKTTLFVILFFLTAWLIGCDDNPLEYDNETLLYSNDSLTLYSHDSIKYKALSLFGYFSCSYNTPRKFRLTFTAATNDTSPYSRLHWSIISARCRHTPAQQTHSTGDKYGNDINFTFNQTIIVERSDEYAVVPNFGIFFDTTYNPQNKYIKILNIKFYRYDN